MFGTKTIFFLSLSIGIALAGTIAYAGGKTKLKDITCEQFLGMDESNQNNIVYWIEGASAGAANKSAEDVEVGYDIFGRPVAEVVTACEADKKATLWDKIKKHF